MFRATKIVATLGPASSEPGVLARLLRAGVDVVRLNFSHGAAHDHLVRANLVREIAQKVGKPVALMADLQGPKIRVGKLAEGKVMLGAGAAFVLDAQRTELGDVHAVGLERHQRDGAAVAFVGLEPGLPQQEARDHALYHQPRWRPCRERCAGPRSP